MPRSLSSACPTFVNDGFARRPQHRRRGTHEESQWEPKVDILKESQDDQRTCSKQGSALHHSSGTGSYNQAWYERCKQDTGTRLGDDAQADNCLADPLGIEHER